MTISEQQLKRLLKCIQETVVDELDCNRCLELLPIYVDLIANGKEVPAELEIVAIHLSQCGCCQEEFEVILSCIQAIKK